MPSKRKRSPKAISGKKAASSKIPSPKKAIPFHWVHGTLIVLAFIIVAVLATTWLINSSSNGILAPKQGVAKVNIFVIANDNCTSCKDISEKVAEVTSNPGLKIVSERTLQYSRPEAKEMIAEYGITRLPVIVMTGNLKAAAASVTDFRVTDGAFVYETPKIPYSTPSGETKGVFSATIVSDPSCTICPDLSTIVSQLREAEYGISSWRVSRYTEEEGKSLVAQYGIQRLPAIVFSAEAAEYPELKRVALAQPDGSLLIQLPENQPPYRIVASGEIAGEISMISLVDSSCLECYPVSYHNQALANPSMGLSKFTSERTVETSSSEGKSLIGKYSITAVPTIILQGDISAYKNLVTVWNTVGSVEEDGSFVFRNPAALNLTYKDIETGQVVVPEQ